MRNRRGSERRRHARARRLDCRVRSIRRLRSLLLMVTRGLNCGRRRLSKCRKGVHLAGVVWGTSGASFDALFGLRARDRLAAAQDCVCAKAS